MKQINFRVIACTLTVVLLYPAFAVSLSNTWAKGKRSKSFDMSGGALIYEYRKEFGKWVGKVVASGIS